MRKVETIKSALKFLVYKQTEQGSYGFSDADDNEISWDEVIEWMEQQPCEDCISRKAVNVLIDELARAISDERCFISRGRSTANIMQDILDLPSVTPKVNTGR